MKVTWLHPKQILTPEQNLVNLPAGEPYDMPDEEALLRIEAGDCLPADKAEHAKKQAALDDAKREKAAAAAAAALEPAPAVEAAPQPDPSASAPDAVSAAPSGPAPGQKAKK